MSDLISRQAAIKAIDDLPNCYNGYSDTYDKAYIIGVLEEVPTIEPKHGKWIKDDVGVHCSECFCGWDFLTGIPVEVYGFHYCPNCGARMERSEERWRNSLG